MTIFVDTLKSLYQKKKIKGQQLRQMVTDGKITDEEYKYITDEQREKKEEFI